VGGVSELQQAGWPLASPSFVAIDMPSTVWMRDKPASFEFEAQAAAEQPRGSRPTMVPRFDLSFVTSSATQEHPDAHTGTVDMGMSTPRCETPPRPPCAEGEEEDRGSPVAMSFGSVMQMRSRVSSPASAERAPAQEEEGEEADAGGEEVALGRRSTLAMQPIAATPVEVAPSGSEDLLGPEKAAHAASGEGDARLLAAQRDQYEASHRPSPASAARPPHPA
jgi:hypothetical protein